MRLPAATVPFLRAALTGRHGEWPPIAAEVVDELATACRWHGVMPLLHEAFRRAPAGVPDRLARAAHDGYLAAAASQAVWRPERAAIARTMRDAGLCMVMLKGAALAGWLYPDAVVRPVGDLDILVAEADLEAASELLAALGYVRAETEAEAWQHHRVFAREPERGFPITVELHRRALASPPYDRLLDTDGLIARSVEWVPGGSAAVGAQVHRALDGPDASWRVPAHVDCLLQLAAHLVLQHAGEERLIWVSDIDRVARAASADADFWPEVRRSAEAAWLARSVGDGLRMSVHWFGTPVAHQILASLDASVSREEERTYRRLRSRAPVGREGARALADVRGIESLRGRLRYAIAYAFPSPGHLRERYRPGSPYALPVYYVRRLMHGIGHILMHAVDRRSRRVDGPPEERVVAP